VGNNTVRAGLLHLLRELCAISEVGKVGDVITIMVISVEYLS